MTNFSIIYRLIKFAYFLRLSVNCGDTLSSFFFFCFCRKREISICRASETQIEPDSNDDKVVIWNFLLNFCFVFFLFLLYYFTFICKEKEVREDGPVPPSTDSFAQDSSHLDSKPAVSEQVDNTYENNTQINNNVAEDNTQGGVQVISLFILRYIFL